MMKIIPIAKITHPSISGILSVTAPSVQLANGIATITIPTIARIRPVTQRLPVDIVDTLFVSPSAKFVLLNYNLVTYLLICPIQLQD